VAGVEQLAGHLGLALAPGEAETVASEYSFQANRKRTETMGLRLRAEGVDLDDPSNTLYYDSRTLLHWNHLRQGRPGDWRTLASPRARAILARLCDGWLSEHGYETDTRNLSAAREHHGLLARSIGWVRGEIAMAKAAIACSLRCATLRHPKVARTVKRGLGMEVDYTTARPIEAPAQGTAPQTRIDGGEVEVPARPHVPTPAQREATSSRDSPETDIA